jgi:hypothetical protein
MYTVGGVDVYIHKYMGPIVDTSPNPGNNDATLPVYTSSDPMYIEDLLLLENRDRAYDPDVYIIPRVGFNKLILATDGFWDVIFLLSY